MLCLEIQASDLESPQLKVPPNHIPVPSSNPKPNAEASPTLN